jgi:hypothetical protein
MENSFKIPNEGSLNLSGYSLGVVIFAILTMLIVFLRKKIKNYLNYRQKLIDYSEDYERKRLCRNDLRVFLNVLYLVSLRLGYR